MKKLSLLAVSVALATSAMVSTSASAEVSYNVGYASEYYYRGFYQKNSSASAGVDYESGSFSVGAWTADVGDGLEVDIYGGYGMELDSGLSFGVGATGYFYTGDFDETYKEINLSAGYGIASLEYSFGEWDGDGGQDYGFLALTLEHMGFYGTFGTFQNDFEGSYFEVGYGTSVGDFDLGISAIFADDDITGADSDEALTFTLGYGF